MIKISMTKDRSASFEIAEAQVVYNYVEVYQLVNRHMLGYMPYTVAIAKIPLDIIVDIERVYA